jgi:hypothetical protein
MGAVAPIAIGMGSAPAGVTNAPAAPNTKTSASQAESTPTATKPVPETASGPGPAVRDKTSIDMIAS